MSKIAKAICDLAAAVKGSSVTETDSIAGAIDLVTANYGTSKQAANQAAAVASGEGDDTVKLTDFNALLTKLKTAGLMAADAASE